MKLPFQNEERELDVPQPAARRSVEEPLSRVLNTPPGCWTAVLPPSSLSRDETLQLTPK